MDIFKCYLEDWIWQSKWDYFTGCSWQAIILSSAQTHAVIVLSKPKFSPMKFWGWKFVMTSWPQEPQKLHPSKFVRIGYLHWSVYNFINAQALSSTLKPSVVPLLLFVCTTTLVFLFMKCADTIAHAYDYCLWLFQMTTYVATFKQLPAPTVLVKCIPMLSQYWWW